MHIPKIAPFHVMLWCALYFVSTFSLTFSKTEHQPDLLDLYFGLIVRLLHRGQTAVLFGAAGHGPVCFLSRVEFIWAWGYKHMNGPQCAGSVLTSPHQCAWDTLVKLGHTMARLHFKGNLGLLWRTRVCWLEQRADLYEQSDTACAPLS